jgi:hypothetical protein
MQQGMRAFQAGRTAFPNGAPVLEAMQSSAAQRQAGVELINENMARLGQQLRAEQQLEAEQQQAKARQAALKQGRQMLDKSLQSFTSQRGRMTGLGSVLGSMKQDDRMGYIQNTYDLSDGDARFVLNSLNEEKTYRIVNPEAITAVYQLYVESGMDPEDAKREIELATQGAYVSHADAAEEETKEVIGIVDRLRGISSESREERRTQRTQAREMDAFQRQLAGQVATGGVSNQQFAPRVPMLPEGVPNRAANAAVLNQPVGAMVQDPTAAIGAFLGAQTPEELAAAQRVASMFPAPQEVQSRVDAQGLDFYGQAIKHPQANVAPELVLAGNTPFQAPMAERPVSLSQLNLSALAGYDAIKSVKDKVTARAVSDGKGGVAIDLELSDPSMSFPGLANQIKEAEKMLTGAAGLRFLQENSNLHSLSPTAAMVHMAAQGLKLPPLGATANPTSQGPKTVDPWATFGVVNP